jgi:hypothetical protein
LAEVYPEADRERSSHASAVMDGNAQYPVAEMTVDESEES